MFRHLMHRLLVVVLGLGGSAAFADGTRSLGSVDRGEYSYDTVHFEFDVGLQLGRLHEQVGPLAPNGLTGGLVISQPLKRDEVTVKLAFVFYDLTVPPAPSVAQEQSAEQNTLRYGNPVLMYYRPWRTHRRQFRLGLGITAPIANLRQARIEKNRADSYAYEGASAMKGHRDLWLWMPSTFSTIGHVDFYLRQTNGWMIGLAADAAAVLSVSDASRNAFRGMTAAPQDVGWIGQSCLDVGYSAPAVRVSLQASYIVRAIQDGESTPLDQTAISLQTRFPFSGWDLLTGFYLPIDSPAGFALNPDGAWSLNIGFSSGTSQYSTSKWTP